ncbi:MAG TPA: 4-phosphoerythronate dehydrogenase [Bacteroidota bacterium]|nr:4-phosphoerythronate dehydrogenase [Bacteroidota bacterium]
MKLVVDKNIPLAEKAFKPLGELRLVETGTFGPETVRDADILIVRSETKVDRRLLDGSAVKFVGTVTIGTDHIDIEYLTSRGIVFASAPGSNANSVKEYIVAALLRLDIGLKGKSVGIVGVGNVGSKVEKACRVLGMEVLLNDPPLARSTGDRKYLPLDALMECDILTVHVPLTRTGPDPTYHLFDRDRLGKLKPESLFLNTSRGAVVETTALRNALSSGHIANSVIDVWENEPDIDLDLLSVVSLATPHIAGYSLDGKVNAVRIIHHELSRFLSGSSDERLDVPSAGTSEIAVPASHQPVERVLYDVIRQCYDIDVDDHALRQMTDIPEADRGAYFRKLRKTYRIRREFSNVSVRIPREFAELEPILSELGFRTSRKT